MSITPLTGTLDSVISNQLLTAFRGLLLPAHAARADVLSPVQLPVPSFCRTHLMAGPTSANHNPWRAFKPLKTQGLTALDAQGRQLDLPGGCLSSKGRVRQRAWEMEFVALAAVISLLAAGFPTATSKRMFCIGSRRC